MNPLEDFIRLEKLSKNYLEGNQERVVGRRLVAVAEKGLANRLIRVRRRAGPHVVVEDGRDRGPVIRSDGPDVNVHADIVTSSE